MTGTLGERSPGGSVFRLSHAPDPWAWPEWTYAKPDGTFGNRWDDPDSLYRVLYACSERLGTFFETLARFRPDPFVAEALAEIDDAGDDDAGDDARVILLPGQVPRSWLGRRRMGEATVEGVFADISHSQSLAWLHNHMSEAIVHHKIGDLDAAAIRMAAPRALTQEISRKVYEMTDPDESSRLYGGIYYQSRLGDNFQNWALFEGVEIRPMLPRDLYPTDPDFVTTMEALNLELVD